MADIVPIKRHREFYRQNKQTAAGVLKTCRARNPTEILCVGYGDDGELFVSGSPPDPGNALWLMEMAKIKLTGQKR